MSMIKKIIRRVKNVFSRPREHDALTGTIKFFDRKKRFGFIISDKNEYFFHAAATHVPDFKSLKDGVHVKFVLISGKKGLQADQIEIIK